MTDIRGEKVDPDKFWSACPNCAALRARLEKTVIEWDKDHEEQSKRIRELERAVEWACEQPYIRGMDYIVDELRRRAGRE